MTALNSIDDMSPTYFRPVIVKLSPDSRYLFYMGSGNLYYKKTGGFKTRKLQFPEGIRYFHFSPDGKHLLVITSTSLYRYNLKKSMSKNESVTFSKQSKCLIGNNGDVLAFTIPDYDNKECQLYIWRSKTDSISLVDDKLGFFEPSQLMYDNKTQTILLSGVNTNFHSQRELRGKGYLLYFSIKDNNEIEIKKTEEKKLYGYFYFPFKNDNVIIHNADWTQLTILDSVLQIKKQVPFEKLEIKSHINRIALSPSNNYIIILGSYWDGERDYCFINIVDGNTFDVIQKIPLKEESFNFETYSISDKGKVYFAYPDLKTERISLYKLKNNKAKLINKLKINSNAIVIFD